MKGRSKTESISREAQRFFVLGLFLLFVHPAEAQLFGGKGLFNRKTEAPLAKTQDEIGIPTPVTGRVEAMKGQEVRFEIQAESKTPAAAVEFLIRTFPSAGRIVSLTSNPNRRNRAIVTYYADPDSSADSDAFAFAVRYRGGRYSSAMRFDIDLVDLKAEITATKEMDFGEVSIGDEAIRKVSVQNMGNGVFRRQLMVAPPWYLREPKGGLLILGAGQKRDVELAFRPDMLGETSYFLSFSRSKQGTTKLFGKGGEPFFLESEQVELSLQEDSSTRRGVVKLRNPGKKPIRINARGSNRLQQSLEEQYLLAPEKTTEIKLALGNTDMAPFDGMVQFYLDNGYTKTAQVIAPVVPGRIEVSVPNAISSEVINFGKINAGKSTERGIVLTNRGGVAVPLEFHIPEPFRLLTDPGPQLAPLSEVNLSIGFYPPASNKGLVDVTMNVLGLDQNIPIRLLGNVVRPKDYVPGKGGSSAASPMKGFRLSAGPAGVRKSSPAESKDLQPTNSNPSPDRPPGRSMIPDVPVGNGRNSLETPGDEERSPLGWVNQPILIRETNPELRQPEDLTMVEAGANSVTIGWTAPKNSDLCQFDIELSGVFLDTENGNRPTNVWIPFGDVEFERIGRLVKAKLSGLMPNSQYELRVFTVDENKRSSVPSETMVAKTDLPMDWTYIYAACGILAISLLAYGIWRVFQERRGEVYQAQYAED